MPAGLSIFWQEGKELFETRCFKKKEKKKACELRSQDDTNHVFGSDQKVFVPANWNVFLHEAEVVEAADKQPAAAHPQVEVKLLAAVPAHGQSNVRTAKTPPAERAQAFSVTS